MQLMKQNGIQVNNNNSNSAERLSAQQNSPKRAAAQARGLFVCRITLRVSFSWRSSTFPLTLGNIHFFVKMTNHAARLSASNLFLVPGVN